MIFRILIPILILAVGFASMKWLGKPVDEPTPVHQPPRKLKTEYLEMTRVNFPVILQSQGTIKAHHTTTVTALVPGTIAAIHPCFEDGAFFAQGEILAELDPADLQAALTAAEARLAQAEAALAQEEARAKQARLNWDDIGYEDEPSPLVLRVPQLKEAKARVDSAQADLDQAVRNLERAQIRAPFDGRVKTRLVGLGQVVSPATPLGEVFATDYAEVRLPLAPDQLPFVVLPDGADDPAVRVTLHDALSSKPNQQARHSWEARIVRTEGTLDEASRELVAIARIDDPFGRTSGRPELRIGQPVRAEIHGITLEDVFVIPRSAMRGINRIYRIDPTERVIRRAQIEPVFSNAEVLVLRDGLSEGDWLATSRLPYAPDGAPVEILLSESRVAESSEHKQGDERGGS